MNYVEKFREAIAAGKLEFVGMPFPPRNICTDFGETALRSMRRSREVYRSQLGIEPNRFYSHDANMTPQLPQLMALCGYDTYCIAENWWGQGRSIPNSRDGYFRTPDGSQVRILDSWYHGVPPSIAARRAVQQGKPAVLCNEEFACLDRTVFLEPSEVEKLAAEGIFLQPITLAEYQRVTESFAKELVYEGDDALCYKGWTGGGEGEFEFEKANRRLETQLVALENLVALARWVGISVDQGPIDERWDFSLRAGECHHHWGNGNADTSRRLREAAAWANTEMTRVAGEIAARVTAQADGIAVFNPAGLRRNGLVRFNADASVKSITAAGQLSQHQVAPVQPDPDQPGILMAAVKDLPSMGYRHYRSESSAPVSPTGVTAEQSENAVTLMNNTLRVRVSADGQITSLTRMNGAGVVPENMHQLWFARPKEKVPRAPLSTASNPLNFDYFAGVRATAPPKIICAGPVMAAVEYYLQPIDYPTAKLTLRFALVADEPQVRVTLTMAVSEPTGISPDGGPGPHEGTYIPGIFVGFPMPADAKPLADMAYCTTDNVLTSTNHETFMNLPFRNGTFNTLSLAGPSGGEYAVLTRGLPDFFVVLQPRCVLGMSLGLGSYQDRYVHEYAIFVPGSADRDRAAQQTYQAAQAFLAEPLAVPRRAGEGSLPVEGSLIGSTAETTLITGAQLLNDALQVRVLNLANRSMDSEFTGIVAPCLPGRILPRGDVSGRSIELGPKAIRELRIAAPPASLALQ